MKKILATTIAAILLQAQGALALEKIQMKIQIIDAASLYQATVTQEQFEKNEPTKHLFEGTVVDREIAKKAFIEGKTSCRILVDKNIPKVTNEMILSSFDTVGSDPTRKVIILMDTTGSNIFPLTCQSSGNITKESVLSTLGALVKSIE